MTFDFEELSAENDNTKATTAATRMQMLLSAQQNQVLSAQEVRDAIRNDKLYALDFLSEAAPDEEEHDTLGLSEFDLDGVPAEGDLQKVEPPAPLDDASKYAQETAVNEALMEADNERKGQST